MSDNFTPPPMNPEPSNNPYGNGNNGQPNNPYGDTNNGQPNYNQAPMGQPPMGVQKPSNYLIPNILATLLCCIPLGIVGIVFSSRVDSAFNAGDYAGAQEASNKAKLFMIISIVVGLIGIVLYVIAAAMGVLDE